MYAKLSAGDGHCRLFAVAVDGVKQCERLSARVRICGLLGENLCCVACQHPLLAHADIALGVDGRDARSELLRLGAADRVHKRVDLPIRIRNAKLVEIYQHQ